MEHEARRLGAGGEVEETSLTCDIAEREACQLGAGYDVDGMSLAPEMAGRDLNADEQGGVGVDKVE